MAECISCVMCSSENKTCVILLWSVGAAFPPWSPGDCMRVSQKAVGYYRDLMGGAVMCSSFPLAPILHLVASAALENTS